MRIERRYLSRVMAKTRPRKGRHRGRRGPCRTPRSTTPAARERIRSTRTVSAAPRRSPRAGRRASERRRRWRRRARARRGGARLLGCGRSRGTVGGIDRCRLGWLAGAGGKARTGSETRTRRQQVHRQLPPIGIVVTEIRTLCVQNISTRYPLITCAIFFGGATTYEGTICGAQNSTRVARVGVTRAHRPGRCHSRHAVRGGLTGGIALICDGKRAAVGHGGGW